MNKKLQRSKNNKVIAGVCGGIAEYFSIDPTVVRLVWVVIGLAYGFGLVAYIIAAIIMPEKKTEHGTNNFNQGETDGSSSEFNPNEWKDEPQKFDSDKSRVIIGGAIILLGVLFLFREFFSLFDIKYLVPVILIVIGFGIIYKGRRNDF